MASMILKDSKGQASLDFTEERLRDGAGFEMVLRIREPPALKLVNLGARMTGMGIVGGGRASVNRLVYLLNSQGGHLSMIF